MGWFRNAYNGTTDWVADKVYNGIMWTGDVLGADTVKLNDTLAGQTPEDRARAPLFHALGDVGAKVQASVDEGKPFKAIGQGVTGIVGASTDATVRTAKSAFKTAADIITPNWLNMENILTGGAAFLAGTLGGNMLFGGSGLGLVTGALTACASLFFKGDVKSLFSKAASDSDVAQLDSHMTPALVPA